jgi:hypothetical protein
VNQKLGWYVKGEYLFKSYHWRLYTVVVSYIGYAKQRQTGYVLHKGDAIRVKISMQETNQSREAVEVELEKSG